MNDPPSARQSAERPRTPLSRAFHRFWAGSLAANLADGVMLTALPMVAAMLTNDPLLVSGLMVARFLPWLLFGLVVGVIVDRVDRGRLMVAANLVRGGALLVFAGLVATENAAVWALYAVMFTVMLCEVFYDLAGRAILPALVSTEDLDRANGRLVGGKTVTEDFAGAPLAGLLFVVAAFLPLAVNAGAYLLGAFVLLGLPSAVRRPGGAPGEGDRDDAARSVFVDMGEGLRFVFGDRSFRATVVFNVVTNMAFVSQAGVLVLLVQEHFGVPEALYGVFLASSAVGALIGAGLASRLVARAGRFPVVMAAFTTMGLCCAGFGLAPHAYVAALAWLLLGAAMAVSNITVLGAVQVIVPATHLGRVMSCVQVLGFGMAPLGAFAGGLIGRVELFYVPLTSGALILLGLILAAPSLRRVLARAGERETANSGDDARGDL